MHGRIPFHVPDRINVALVFASAREGRFCDTIVYWAAAQIWERSEFALALIDPAEFDLSPRPDNGESDDLAELQQHIGKADAFIVVTPEENGGYPAEINRLVDAARREWQAKPVAFISYGEVSGGLRAVEQLRLVFAELDAVTIRDGVSFTNPRDQFGADGEMIEPAAARQAMATLLARLHWWAVSLRKARNAVPYDAVVV
jgi:NAD(P)H-dependent FMN reductase